MSDATPSDELEPGPIGQPSGQVGDTTPDDGDESGDQRSHRTSLIAIAALAGLCLLVAFVVWWSGVLPTIRVPDVENQTLTEARLAIKEARLTPGPVKYRYVNGTAAGLVARTSPAAGTRVAARSVVDIVYSVGSTQSATPDLRGLPEADATQAAKQLGLTLVAYAGGSESAPMGVVIDQFPPAGAEGDTGSVIEVVVVKKRVPDITVPDVQNMSQIVAATLVNDAGFRPKYRYVAGSPVGIVMYQYPAGNMSAPLGSVVTMDISVTEIGVQGWNYVWPEYKTPGLRQ